MTDMNMLFWEGLWDMTRKAIECSKLDELFSAAWKIKMLKVMQTMESWLVKLQKEG